MIYQSANTMNNTDPCAFENTSRRFKSSSVSPKTYNRFKCQQSPPTPSGTEKGHHDHRATATPPPIPPSKSGSSIIPVKIFQKNFSAEEYWNQSYPIRDSGRL
jgi:hypothetical protein